VLKFKCQACDKELERAGALLFSPPINNMTLKHHLCEDCYDKAISYFNKLRNDTPLSEKDSEE